MTNMGKGTSIENNLHAKTGYINRCRAYSGYVTNKKGRVLAFSIIFNNYNGSAREAKLKIEQWMLALVDL
jgi:D-alanyl-D-alanine carboxypeptidase/D-alanyl-D-alanine-endopeptidase (penicillin-binding protein 4)